MLASDVISRVRDLISDTVEPYRWSTDELLRWLSDAQRSIVIVIPEAYATSRVVQLTRGSYRQSIPADALRLLDVPRNMGFDGATPGPVIRLTGRQTLDAQLPTWMSTPGDTVEHYVYDFKVPRQFLIYPQPADLYAVELVFSRAPAEIRATTAVLVLDDTYAEAIVDYVCFRAFAKEMDSATSAAKATAYKALFDTALSSNVSSTAARVPASAAGGAVK